jgi:hypothetical protein
MRTVRHVMLLLLAISSAGATAGAAVTAQESADASESTTPTYLFVQQATGGAFAPAGAGGWELTLTGVSPQSFLLHGSPGKAGWLPGDGPVPGARRTVHR